MNENKCKYVLPSTDSWWWSKKYKFLLSGIIYRLNDAKPSANTQGSNSPRKFVHKSTGCVPNNSSEFKFDSTDDSPRSPKITYTTPPASANSVQKIESENESSTTTPSSGYYEPKSPQYTPYDHHSPRKSSESPRKFVFDAVSPRRESIGLYHIILACIWLLIIHFIFLNSFFYNGITKMYEMLPENQNYIFIIIYWI